MRLKIQTWEEIHRTICNNSEKKIQEILDNLTNARYCLYYGVVEKQFDEYLLNWMRNITYKFDQRQGNSVIVSFKNLSDILNNCALSCAIKL